MSSPGQHDAARSQQLRYDLERHISNRSSSCRRNPFKKQVVFVVLCLLLPSLFFVHLTINNPMLFKTHGVNHGAVTALCHNLNRVSVHL